MHLIDHQQKERLKDQMDGGAAGTESANFVGHRRQGPARPFGNNNYQQRSFGNGNGNGNRCKRTRRSLLKTVCESNVGLYVRTGERIVACLTQRTQGNKENRN